MSNEKLNAVLLPYVKRLSESNHERYWNEVNSAKYDYFASWRVAYAVTVESAEKEAQYNGLSYFVNQKKIQAAWAEFERRKTALRRELWQKIIRTLRYYLAQE